MSNNFNENTRVQVPAALHLVKLGYTYLSHISEDDYDNKTNILKKVFIRSVKRINNLTDAEAENVLREVLRCTSNEDLGREFYGKLNSISGIKLIDYNDPTNNEWHVTTEFTCEDRESGDNFRPDITCFVNGMPLVFIEVKKPNNHEGILAERDRINKRMAKRAFRSFFNVTQLMIFSNNQEYDHENIVPIQGAFYATTSKTGAFFNVFREEDRNLIEHCGYNPNLKEGAELEVLSHRNCIPIRNMTEYQTNMRPGTPTNRIITSMLSRERLLFLLRYGFAYVEYRKENERGEQVEVLEKHVMRYQQLFATYAIRKKLEDGVHSGIIWHTQGSGKTALAYYNVKSLTDYYARQHIAVKFYFIVDRLDLMNQASNEFAYRGLSVRTADSREQLMRDFRSNTVVENAQGRPEVMVVNIQKFAEDHQKVDLSTAYNTRLIRVFFIDEAHRGYNPKGSFLANLLDADKDAVKIALTGTPLLKEEMESWRVFGDYIHTYYYDKSIADGYTLKLMREDIETQYKEQITDILERLTNGVEVRRSDIDHHRVIESQQYLSALLDYCLHDMRKFRIQMAAPAVGGMIVCETNPQARLMKQIFDAKQLALPEDQRMRAELILHDEGDKLERKETVEEFKKKETIDFLIVNAMLLTGFDAPRLKKLYLCRKLDGHGLLQALTRVNRRYRDFRYGYVVDFANIKENFIETNNRYLQELNRTNEDSVIYIHDVPSQGAGDVVMPTSEEIKATLFNVKDKLFSFDTENVEDFREQLDGINDLEQLYDIRKVLAVAKALGNQVRSFGDEEMKQRFNETCINNLPLLMSEINHRIDRINLLHNTDHTSDVNGIINEALSMIDFKFRKRMEEELQIIYNDLRQRYESVLTEFNANFDQQEDKYVSLSEDFREYFRKRGFTPETVAQAKEDIGYMDEVMKKIREINRRNNMLKRKYQDDEKFVRIHKRILEENEKRETAATPKHPIISKRELEIAESLQGMKEKIDKLIYLNVNVLQNQGAFEQDVLRSVSEQLHKLHLAATLDDRKYLRNQIASEYFSKYNRI